MAADSGAQPELLKAAEEEVRDSDAFKNATADGRSDEELQRILRKDSRLECALLPSLCPQTRVRKPWGHDRMRRGALAPHPPL